MPYTEPVKFSSTGNYGCNAEDEDDIYTVDEFRELVSTGAFIDYDGHGRPVKDKLADRTMTIRPSTVDEIPKDATHIVWYNR
jgi:hypothetical protein